jgi:WD40 repeat protein
MPRGERPLGPGDDVLVAFARDLRRLRVRAGSPTYRELGGRAHFSASALSEAAGGRKFPSLAVTVAYVAACGGDTGEWETRWRHTAARLAASTTTDPEKSRTDSVANSEEPAPYVGLVAFQPSDAEWFFGRDALVTELVTRLYERRFLGVFGPSGCGKSSVLRAGLVARLNTQNTPGNTGCPVVVFTPGRHPVEECAVRLAGLLGQSPAAVRDELAADPASLHMRVRQALIGHPDGVDLVVVVDQFEEVFTLCADTQERTQFVDALITAATAETSRTRVVLGVRADFYGYCARYPQLVDALRDGQVMVGPMSVDELRQAITQPAEHAGCRVETGLVTRMVSEAAGQPGVLPLVSHALLETWRRRRGTTLTLTGYQAAGGIHHALALTAETVYTQLDNHQQQVARQIFLRLIALGEGTEDTKRRVPRRELDIHTTETDTADTGTVLNRLTSVRLITVDQDGVELAHEALIQHWPRLREWLATDRDGLRIHRDLTHATHTWQALDRDPEALYRGIRLARAQEWATGGDRALNPTEREFLHTSLATQAREHAATTRRTRWLRQLVAVLGVLLLVAVVAVGVAVRAQQTANEQRKTALAQKALHEASAMRASNPALAWQLALAAYRLDPTKPARDTLHEIVAAPYATLLDNAMGSVFGASVSADGRLLATVGHSERSRISLWDISDPLRPRRLPTLPHMNTFGSSLAFSPNDRTLAITGDGSTQLWDLTDPHHPRPLAELPDDGMNPLTGEAGTAVAFSPDGRVLATARSDTTTHLWDITDVHHPVRRATLPNGPDTGTNPGLRGGVAFSPRGHVLATTARDQTTRLWDITNPHDPQPLGALTDHTGSPLTIAFSPDGSVLATGSDDMTGQLWDLTDPRRPRLLTDLTGHAGAVLALAFSPDGHTLATASGDRTTRLWNIADVRQPSELSIATGHTLPVRAVIFSPDGRTLITGGADETVRLEDISRLVLASHAGSVLSVAYRPQGDIAATSSDDKTVRLWDLTDQNRPRQIRVIHTDDEVTSVSFSPNGRLLLTNSRETIHLWEVADPTTPQELTSLRATGFASAAFSPHGGILATADPFEQINSYIGPRVRLLNISDPNQPQPIGWIPASADIVAFSPNGYVVTASSGGDVNWWDITDPSKPQYMASIITDARIKALNISGNILAVSNPEKRRTQLWDLADPRHAKTLSTIPIGGNGETNSVSFSPDGRRLATTGTDRTAQIWDISNPRQPVAHTTLPHAAEVLAVAFSPDGNTILTTDEDHFIRQWHTDVEDLATRICDTAYPRLTTTEWQRHFPNVNYQPPCQ